MGSNGKIMKRFVILLVAVASAAIPLITGNTSAATWPEKGKLMTIYVSTGAGGSIDMNVRLYQPYLEKELGIKTVVLNKPGGANVIGITEFVNKSGTDGYTVLALTPSFFATYLDPSRKATFKRQDIKLCASITATSLGIAVKKGRYKTLKDLVEAARANPGKISIACASALSIGDMGVYKLEQAAGVKFAHIPFDLAGEQRAALLGGHADAEVNPKEEQTSGHKSGEIEMLTILAEKESKFAPGIKPVVELGYNAAMESYSGFGFKAGTPQEIVDTMAAAVKRIAANPDFQKQAEKMNIDARVLVGKEYEDYHNHFEAFVKGLIDDLSKKK
jgi:tripartite-type tricarboxylate transporter receptor subunit TctC